MLLFLLYEILGLFSFWLFYSRTKDALNPIGIMSLSLIGVFGFTSLELYPGQPHLSPITHLVVLMAFFEIVLVGYFVLRPQTTAERCLPVVTERFSKILRISVVLVTIVAIVAIIISIGEADGFRESSLDKKGAISLGDSNKLINYGIQFIPYVALFAVFELLFKQDIERSSKLFDWGVIVGCILFSLFVLYSRGTLLVLALGSLFLVSRRWRIPLRYYVLALVLLILALSICGDYRQSIVEHVV